MQASPQCLGIRYTFTAGADDCLFYYVSPLTYRILVPPSNISFVIISQGIPVEAKWNHSTKIVRLPRSLLTQICSDTRSLLPSSGELVTNGSFVLEQLSGSKQKV